MFAGFPAVIKMKSGGAYCESCLFNTRYSSPGRREEGQQHARTPRGGLFPLCPDLHAVGSTISFRVSVSVVFSRTPRSVLSVPH